MLVCVVSGLCHGVSTQVEFCFLFLGVRVSPSFPFLLLGLCVCVRVCFRKSCFVLPAALAWFRFAGPSLPPSLPPSLLFSLPPSRPPLSGGRGPGVPGMSLVPPLSAHPAPSPRRPPARVSVECPPTTLESRGGGRGGDRGSFVAASRGEISRLLSLPLRPGSRRVASLGGGGSGPSSGVWAAGAVASPAAGDSDPSSGRSSRLSGATWRPLVYCPSPSGASASPSGGL
jgi:hypothetical protein